MFHVCGCSHTDTYTHAEVEAMPHRHIFLHSPLGTQCGLIVTVQSRISQPFLAHYPILKSTNCLHSSDQEHRPSSKYQSVTNFHVHVVAQPHKVLSLSLRNSSVLYHNFKALIPVVSCQQTVSTTNGQHGSFHI